MYELKQKHYSYCLVWRGCTVRGSLRPRFGEGFSKTSKYLTILADETNVYWVTPGCEGFVGDTLIEILWTVPMIAASVFVLADISDRSAETYLFSLYRIIVHRIKVSQKCLIQFWKHNHWWQLVLLFSKLNKIFFGYFDPEKKIR